MKDVWYVLLILIPFLGLLFILSVDNYYLRRRVKRLRNSFEYLRAGNDMMKNYGFNPAECAESHLPGDCPLCGAK